MRCRACEYEGVADTERIGMPKLRDGTHGGTVMDLQRIVDAPDDSLFTAKFLRGPLKEAIAELEKPADEDADKVTSEIEDIHFLLNDGSIMNKRHGKCASLIQQYAEAYHAKKCKICLTELDDIDRENMRQEFEAPDA